jgi:hypothetical protein
MDKLSINPSDDHPKVIFDNKSGILEISGKSLPEDVNAFYKPILQWLKNYAGDPNETTDLNFRLTFLNSASSKLILDILLVLEEMNLKGEKVVVNWYYPEYDEDMKEVGIEFSEMVDIPFKNIAYTPG